MPIKSYGFDGGKLFDPVTSFVTAIGDAIINILQSVFMPDEENDAVIYDGSTAEKILNIYSSIPIVSNISSWTADFLYGDGTWESCKDQGIAYIKYGPATIFSGKIDLFNINLLYSDIKETTDNGSTVTHTSDLKIVLEKMYYILRNIVLVLFMSVLVYVGIKMVLSSTSNQDKAKYKILFKDWIIGMLLLFIIHYIMIGISLLSTKLFDVFSWATITDDGTDLLFSNIRNEVSVTTSIEKIGFVLMYITMVIYTVMFTIQYIKRLIYVAFLTLVAPFVALFYPIDKMKDGKAQAFNMWLKEYMYNVLIQVFHVILYYVLIESAIDVAINNVVFGLIVIGSLLQVEKLLKSIFGLEAQGGMFGGKSPSALGGAMTMTAVNALGRALGKGGKPPKQGVNGKNDEDNSKIRTADSGKTLNSLLASSGDEDSTGVNNPIENIRDDVQQMPENREGDNGSNNGDAGNSNSNQNSNGNGTSEGTNSNGGQGNPSNHSSTNNIGNLNKAKNKKKHPVLKGVAKTAGHYSGRLAKGVLKTGVKLSGAAALGMIGVASGLASDDFDNVFKYGAAASGVGYALGGKALKVPGGVKRGVNNVKNTYRGYAYPGDSSYKNKEADAKWLKDKEIRELYAEKLNVSKKEAKEIMQKHGQKYREYGITDDSQIIKCLKLDKEKYGENLSSNMRIAAAKFAGSVKTSDKFKEMKESFNERARNDQERDRYNKIADAVQQMNDIV
jgi:hypothetical protein